MDLRGEVREGKVELPKAAGERRQRGEREGGRG